LADAFYDDSIGRDVMILHLQGDYFIDIPYSLVQTLFILQAIGSIKGVTVEPDRDENRKQQIVICEGRSRVHDCASVACDG
jgi:hypothetical protein